MARSINVKPTIILVAHNLRSTHNVGSLFRTAEGLGVNELILSGYTPYPRFKDDPRLKHLVDKLDKQISKTALGAQNTLKWRKVDDLTVLSEYKAKGYQIVGLEQAKTSLDILSYSPLDKLVLLVGNELTGLEEDDLKRCDELIEIQMLGSKESFNVVQAAAMALFYLRFVK